MTLKHVLKLFSKTEVQEDKTHPTPPLEREGALGALNNAELYPLPLEQASRGCKAKPYPFIASAVIGEREELLCEQSELSNSGEGYKDLPSPDATRHPLPREGRKFRVRSTPIRTYSPIHLFTSLFTLSRPPPFPQNGEIEQLNLLITFMMIIIFH